MENASNQTTKNIFSNSQKKNSYVKLEAGAYPHEFIGQVKNARSCLANDDLRFTKMVRRNRRSGQYEVTMGFGARNWWFENDLIKQGDVMRYWTKEEAMEALDEIYAAARAHKFDDALEALRIQRQEQAALMLENKKICGFHKLPAPERVALLEAPEPAKLLEAPMKLLPNS